MVKEEGEEMTRDAGMHSRVKGAESERRRMKEEGNK